MENTESVAHMMHLNQDFSVFKRMNRELQKDVRILEKYAETSFSSKALTNYRRFAHTVFAVGHTYDLPEIREEDEAGDDSAGERGSHRRPDS